MSELPEPRKVSEVWVDLRPRNGVVSPANHPRPVSSQPSKPRRDNSPKELLHPIECPYLGERLIVAGDPATLKCGCSKSLVFPLFICNHSEKEWVNKSGEAKPGRCLPTVGYQPPESHAPKRFYTACLYCPLNPNHKESDDAQENPAGTAAS